MKSLNIKYSVLVLLMGLATVFTSCKDDDDDHHDPHPVNSATITITSPAEGSQVNANQTVAITGSISAQNTLHGYTLTIRKKADSTVLFTENVHDHAATITINKTWNVGAVAAHTDLELEVVTALDHDGNTASKKVNFHAMP